MREKRLLISDLLILSHDRCRKGEEARYVRDQCLVDDEMGGGITGTLIAGAGLSNKAAHLFP